MVDICIEMGCGGRHWYLETRNCLFDRISSKIRIGVRCHWLCNGEIVALFAFGTFYDEGEILERFIRCWHLSFDVHCTELSWCFEQIPFEDTIVICSLKRKGSKRGQVRSRHIVLTFAKVYGRLVPSSSCGDKGIDHVEAAEIHVYWVKRSANYSPKLVEAKELIGKVKSKPSHLFCNLFADSLKTNFVTDIGLGRCS